MRCRHIVPDTSEQAFDAQPRREWFTNELVSSAGRFVDIVTLLEGAGAPLGQLKTAIDVGCGPNKMRDVMKERYPNIETVGFDQYPHEEHIRHLDLEHDRLPYADGEIDIAICSHVLEHVDNFHGLSAELFRVARYVVILLPNPLLWPILAKVMLGKSILPIMGLPLGRPKDRHRWVYTVGEAVRWARHAAGKWDRALDVRYRVDWRLPTFMGRLRRDMFVLEVAFIFVPSDAKG